MCVCERERGGGGKKSQQLGFYDDITTVSDICVMAASRLQVQRGATRCQMFYSGGAWRGVLRRHRKEQRGSGWGGEITSSSLYGVIGRYTAAPPPALPPPRRVTLGQR